MTSACSPEPAFRFWLRELRYGAQRVLIRLLIAVDEGRDVLPPARGCHILHRQIFAFGRPEPPECVPEAAVRLRRARQLVCALEPVRCQMACDRTALMSPALRMRKHLRLTYSRMHCPKTGQLIQRRPGCRHDSRLAQFIMLRAPPDCAIPKVDIIPPQAEHGTESPSRGSSQHDERTAVASPRRPDRRRGAAPATAMAA